MVDEPTGFATPTGIDWNTGGTVGTVQYGGGNKNMVALFFTKAKHNPAKSNEAGRPIYDDVVFVRIAPPGERLNIVERPATPDDQRRYALQWAQFAQNKQQVPDGTPIDLLYPDHPSVAAMLRANGVYTVEQCAELSGPAIDTIGMGAQRYCNDAQKYIQASNKGVKASQLRHELEERDSQIRTLTNTVQSLKAEVDRLRDLNTNSVGLAQVQQLIAGQQGRPQYPVGAPKQMTPAFDAQTAQINATHATADIAKAAGKKRSRARIQA
jgi:hypothetical protein